LVNLVLQERPGAQDYRGQKELLDHLANKDRQDPQDYQGLPDQLGLKVLQVPWEILVDQVCRDHMELQDLKESTGQLVQQDNQVLEANLVLRGCQVFQDLKDRLVVQETQDSRELLVP